MDTGVPNITAFRTLAGSAHGEPPRYSLLQRAHAASVAGITHIGATDADLNCDPFWLQRQVHDHGVRVASVEWVNLEEERDHDAQLRMFHLADVLHIPRIHVGLCSSQLPEFRTLVHRLGKLAFRAGDHGLTVAVEPVSFGALDTVSRVQDIITATREPNVGLLLDAYHQAREHFDTDVSHVNPDMVCAIQLCGVMRFVNGTVLEDCQNNRLLPGKGDFPLLEWLANLRAAGVTAPIEAEVISSTLRAMSIYDAAHAVSDAMHRIAVNDDARMKQESIRRHPSTGPFYVPDDDGTGLYNNTAR